MDDDESPDEKTDKSHKSKSITLPDITNSNATPRREKIGTSITKVDASLSNNLSFENLQTHGTYKPKRHFLEVDHHRLRKEHSS